MRLFGPAAVTLFALVGAATHAARFTDTFSTPPAARDRVPFMWDGFYSGEGLGQVWRSEDGVLEYRAEEAMGSSANVSLAGAGVEITDGTDWSLEVGFRHVSGTAPRPAYETVAYVCWNADEAGEMRILALMYDAAAEELSLYNGAGVRETVPADLSGEFHPVRVTVANGEVRVYVDVELRVGPLAARPRAYAAQPAFHLGPVTSGDAHSLCYQFDYLAFTDEGAFPANDERWKPAGDAEPIAEGLRIVESPLNQEPYAGISVLKREKGSSVWKAATPEHWRKLAKIRADDPASIETPLYRYEDEEGPSKQNLHPDTQCLEDGNRCVAVAMLTRGIDDTPTGFMDYKLWYRLSTDGGETYDDLRPMIEQGGEYSPMHPNRHVWIGKNSFCYASIPPFLKMSNGEIIMPFYFAPLDEEGNYFNPLTAYTYSHVAAAIGTWNEAGDDLIWAVSGAIAVGPDDSSRGLSECAVIELAKPGHIFMVMRGSNHPNPNGNLPAVQWRTLSTDYGRTWTEPEPFTYSDGDEFWSPSSCSAFIRHSATQKVYWIGNITRSVPRGNSPRYPLIIAELDEETLGLRKETLTIIDDREASDPPELQLSNFRLVEDAATGHIVLRLTRYMREANRDNPNFGKHSYVVEVK